MSVTMRDELSNCCLFSFFERCKRTFDQEIEIHV